MLCCAVLCVCLVVCLSDRFDLFRFFCLLACVFWLVLYCFVCVAMLCFGVCSCVVCLFVVLIVLSC